MGHDENVERILRELHDYAQIDIIREDGTCDWEAVRKAYDKERVDERELWYVLCEKGILTGTIRGNYIILRSGHLWGPYYGMAGHLAFARKADAELYFDLFNDKHGGLDDGRAQIIHCTEVQFRRAPQK